MEKEGKLLYQRERYMYRNFTPRKAVGRVQRERKETASEREMIDICI